MPLSSGTRFGPFEIVAPLGAGGMGEVYRARDTRLKREVAIKVLSEGVSQDPDRHARFRREAELLATLNHPAIAIVHGLEEANGVVAIVMELVEGETLAERIATGSGHSAPGSGSRAQGSGAAKRSALSPQPSRDTTPARGLPVDEALTLARQIAEALEAAHERGVVHRDLKPANIKITPDGRVKVLDFGLAKMIEGPGAVASAGSGAMSPTLTLSTPFGGTPRVAATFAGTILGTPAYMSPEQARGKPVDRRTDIWAFGCVLFEMLSGRDAFELGETMSDAIAAILTREPDWTALPADVPAHIRLLIRRCLQKDPQKRLRDIGDARIQIDEGTTEESPIASGASLATPRPLWQRAMPAAIAAVVVGAAVGAGMSRLTPPPASAAVTRLSFTLGEGQQLSRPAHQFLAISPDGTQVIYVANRRLAMETTPPAVQPNCAGALLTLTWLPRHPGAGGVAK